MSTFTKAASNQICNICRQQGKLSKDHVPPRGTLIFQDVGINNFENLFKGTKKKFTKISQNGIKFETICESCNNKLGHDLDAGLKSFTSNITEELSKPIPINKTLLIECFPSTVIRSILGHILAAKTETDNVTPDRKIRSFLFDYSKPIHKDIHVFYWFYPFANIRITRDFVMPISQDEQGNIKMGFCNIIKFFPIAFLVTDVVSYAQLPNLNQYRNFSVRIKVKIPLSIGNIHEEGWPEIPSNSGNPFVAGGKSFFQDSITASPRNRLSSF